MIAALRKNMTRAITLVVVVAVVAGGAWYFFIRSSGEKTVTAKFPEAIGIYPGTPVKILGVQVGDVTSVVPKADYVAVKMEYSGTYKLPAKAKAYEVANSLVSDRFIQLDAYKSGDAMKSGAVIPTDRTSHPAELDDIYSALNKVSVALGPAGVNKGGKKSGALSALVNVAAANLKGNGQALGDSVTQLSKAAKTLADNKGSLFQTIQNLQKFTTTLKNNDAAVRGFNNQLAQAASDLAGERSDLGAALHDLGIALDAVNGFVKKNAAKFHSDFNGLRSITDTVVKQKASVNEALALAPAALANIVHAYQPNIGAIATRGNLASLTNLDPKTLLGQVCTTLSGIAGGVLGSLGGNVSQVCAKLPASAPSASQLPTIPGLSTPPTTPSLPGATGLPTVPGATGLPTVPSALSGLTSGGGS